MPCTLKNNSFFVGDMGIVGGAYLTEEGKCRCGLFPFEHPEPPQPLSFSVVFPTFADSFFLLFLNSTILNWNSTLIYLFTTVSLYYLLFIHLLIHVHILQQSINYCLSLFHLESQQAMNL